MTWLYPLFFCSGASVSLSIYDGDIQNSHSFQSFFPKIYHTDRNLVLSLALLVILRHAPSSMVYSRSFLGQQGSHHVISPCYPGPACYSQYRETVFQLVCLALCLSVCILYRPAAAGLCATLQNHIVAATVLSQLFCRLGTNTAKASVCKGAWYHKN